MVFKILLGIAKNSSIRSAVSQENNNLLLSETIMAK